MPRIRRIALGLWVMLLLVLTVLYAVNPGLATPERLVDTLRQSGQPVLLGYIVLSVVRAFTLIPSTVLIIVGTLLFPDRPWFVMVSSLGGVVASAVLIYFFFEFLGLGELFERNHARRVRWLEQQMNQKGSGSSWAGPRSRSCRPTSSATWPEPCGCSSGSSPPAWRWARCRSWASTCGPVVCCSAGRHNHPAGARRRCRAPASIAPQGRAFRPPDPVDLTGIPVREDP